MYPLSICCIIKNEQNQILRMLKDWNNSEIELIIVDTGSTDQSLELLEKKAIN